MMLSVYYIGDTTKDLPFESHVWCFVSKLEFQLQRGDGDANKVMVNKMDEPIGTKNTSQDPITDPEPIQLTSVVSGNLDK